MTFPFSLKFGPYTNVSLPKLVGLSLLATIQSSPQVLIFEETHSMDVLSQITSGLTRSLYLGKECEHSRSPYQQ